MNNSLQEDNQIRIVVYHEEDDLIRIREKWDALLLNVPSAGIFLTWEWTMAGWKIFGKGCSLFLVAAYEDDMLVGLAPLRLSHRSGKGIPSYKVLELIPNSPLILGGDHLDIIVVPEKRSAIIYAMMKSIMAGSWDVLRWENISLISPNIDTLTLAFQKGKMAYDIRIATICPYITLPDSWEEYLAFQCSNNFRKILRRKIKRLEKEHSIFIHRADSPADFSYGLKKLEGLHGERWGEMSLFRREGFRAFHEEIAQAFALRGWLRLYLLKVDGEDVAVECGFRYGSTFLDYQRGWKRAWEKDSVATVLLAKVIQQEMIQGAREIDFAQGAEDYKYHWTSLSREEVRITTYRPNWRARLVHLSEYRPTWLINLVHSGRSIVSQWR